MGLLARQQLGKNRLVQRTALVQFDAAEKTQEAALQNAVALRLEIRIHHADALIVRQVLEAGALRALPIGEVFVVEHDHAALDRDIGARRSGRGDKARATVVPGIADQFLDGVGKRHLDDL